MNSKIITGYVIKVVPYGESDAIITFLSSEGICSFRGRGVLKLNSKNYALCLLYTYSEVELEQNHDFYYLKSGKVLSFTNELYENLDAMVLLNLISEAMLTFLKGEINNTNFIAFKKLNEAVSQGDFIFTLTLINLALIIKQCGLEPNTSECVVCGTKNKIVDFSYSQGGFLCAHHSNNANADTNYLKTLRYIFMVDESNYFHYQIEKNLALKLIKEFMKYLKDQFDYRELNFYKVFLEIYR